MRFFGLLFLSLSLSVFSSTKITTQIYDIDYGKNNEDRLILLKSGDVIKIKSHEKRLLDTLEVGLSSNSWFTFFTDNDRFLINLEPSHSSKSVEFLFDPNLNFQDNEEYVPTTIASMEIARKYFRESRRTIKEETQCFNRALVWTYEWWKKHSLKSNKLLIFFTRNYIRRYNFEWWFHIAPYVHVWDDNKVVERVMDVKYSSGPIEFRRWTNIFMNKDPECPVITKYSEYADHPYSGECYIYRTHMYTYQPADLQMYEAWDYKKDSFNLDEVKGAYLEAFDIRLPGRGE